MGDLSIRVDGGDRQKVDPGSRRHACSQVPDSEAVVLEFAPQLPGASAAAESLSQAFAPGKTRGAGDSHEFPWNPGGKCIRLSARRTLWPTGDGA